MISSESKQSQYLRRTIAPYTGQIMILTLVTFGVLFVFVKKNEWGLLLPVPVVWLLFLILTYIGLKYRINWNDKEVYQKASGGSKVCIQYSEITKVTSEISKPGDILAASRPFRRIAIYAGESQDTGKFIDVSLKHFVADDVRKLIRVIQDHRADLALPKNWTK